MARKRSPRKTAAPKTAASAKSKKKKDPGPLMNVRHMDLRDINSVWDFLDVSFRDVNAEEGIEQLAFEVDDDIVADWIDPRYFEKRDMRPLFVGEQRRASRVAWPRRRGPRPRARAATTSRAARSARNRTTAVVRRRRLWLSGRPVQYLIALLVLAGCGRIGFDPTGGDGDGGGDDAKLPVEPGNVSGTRLRAIEAVAPGGAAKLLGWHDLDLDMECRFEIASDGVLRCLPVLGALSLLHTDPGCTVPLGVEEPPADDPQCSQVRFLSDGTGPIFRAGARYFGATYIGMPGQCSAFDPGSQSVNFQIAEEVPPTTFVAATESIVPHGRLSWIVWSAADGAQQLAPELLDTERAERCRWKEVESNEVRCLPPVGVAGLGYTDAACTQIALIGGTATAGGLALTQEPTACAYDSRLFEVGAPITQFYTRRGGACLMFPGAAFAGASEIPLSRYERATLVTAGASQIATASWMTSSGLRSPAGLIDTVHGDRCTPVVETGTVHYICGPRILESDGYGAYTDAACTMVASLDSTSACRRAWPSLITFSGATPSTCEGLAADVFVYDVVVAGPLYDLTIAGCVPMTTPILERSSTKIDATDLPRLQRVTR